MTALEMQEGGLILMLATSSYALDKDEMHVDVVPIVREGAPIPCACGCGAHVPLDRGPRSGGNRFYASDLCYRRAKKRRYAAKKRAA